MQLEAVEPPARRLATARLDAEDPMLRATRRMTDSERGRVEETAARTRAAPGMEVDGEWYQEAWHEFPKAGIAHQARKLLAQGHLHMLGIEACEGPIAR